MPKIKLDIVSETPNNLSLKLEYPPTEDLRERTILFQINLAKQTVFIEKNLIGKINSDSEKYKAVLSFYELELINNLAHGINGIF